MTERFGRPELKQVPMHNDVGGRWTAERRIWQGDGLVAVTSCGFNRMGACEREVVVFSAGMAEVDRQGRDRVQREQLQKGRKL